MESKNVKVVDIGANLLDPMFSGFYNGKQRHASDLNVVLSRSLKGYRYCPDGNGGNSDGICVDSCDGWGKCDSIIVTAGNYEDCVNSIQLCNDVNKRCYDDSDLDRGDNADDEAGRKKIDRLFTTIGVHPTKCSQIYANDDVTGAVYMEKLSKLLTTNNPESPSSTSIVALGELGLDYSRLEYCEKRTQLDGLKLQLNTLCPLAPSLPLFLHNRACEFSLHDVLLECKSVWCKGGADGGRGCVIHSFDDSYELALKFLSLSPNVYIGINGASLRTLENVDVVRRLDVNRMLVESDAPWCECKPSHASYQYTSQRYKDLLKARKKYDKYESTLRGSKGVKNRNEPSGTMAVLEVVANIKRMDVGVLSGIVYENSRRLFVL